VSHVVQDLTALLDGALSPERRAQVEAHLLACAGCRTERRRLEGAVRLLSALPPAPEPRADFGRRFWARLEAEPRRHGLFPALGGWRWIAPLAGATAMAAVLAIGGVRHLGQQREMAAHLDMLEEYELAASLGAVESAEDVEVVAHLDQLEEGRP
jgi:anti-sigma factor RsiW